MGELMTTTGYRVLHDLLENSHNVAPTDIPDLVKRLAAEIGFRDVTIYVADLEQSELVSLPRGAGGAAITRPIENSQAGLCYRTTSLRTAEADTGGLVLWLPLLDGIERIGVIELHTEALSAPALAFARSMTSLVTMIVLSKYMHSDTITSLQRRRPMELSAEMLWAFLPPRSMRTDRATVTAVLEPAYDVGGDAFDHSMIQGTLHASILDAMGHDLASGLVASVALAGCRNARRSGHGLADLVDTVDTHLAETFPGRFCTAVFCHLDTIGGLLSWVNCGHPAPLLLRGKRLLDGSLDREPELPLGLGAANPLVPRTVHRCQLEPGDRVLLYTDGVVEARTGNGDQFGLDNFVDFILRATAAREPVYEALRRLMKNILGDVESRLRDDATIVAVEWHPDGPEPVPETVI
ncbi:PP2C family protein-serine/threonine phosphatase [Streptomyces sp. NPDC003077]|uniref:PP2C family protein-serine/threonine phosphatase n=1 Tax=Streptomyces sp. NPDC003077 TaxID=3154443 RepID=UPI0033B6EC93